MCHLCSESYDQGSDHDGMCHLCSNDSPSSEASPEAWNDMMGWEDCVSQDESTSSPETEMKDSQGDECLWCMEDTSAAVQWLPDTRGDESMLKRKRRGFAHRNRFGSPR